MIDIIVTGGIALFKTCGLLLLAYIFYWRVIDYAHCVWFYGRQGKEICALTPGHLPVLGNIVQCVKSMLKSYREGDNFHIMRHVFDSA